MSDIISSAAAYRNAANNYVTLQAKVIQLRDDLDKATEALRKADMERKRTQRELLEQAER